MFSVFLNFFDESLEVNYSDNLYKDFVNQLGGKQFGNGVFNTFTVNMVERWNGIVTEAYPEFSNMFSVFGYNWMGRCFGVDLRKNTYGNILLFEIGTNDVLEIPCSFASFLNEEIPLYADACLAKTFFDEWMAVPERKLSFGRCAGYKIPLFLGGEDSIANLEESDMEVYWNMITQIKRSI